MGINLGGGIGKLMSGIVGGMVSNKLSGKTKFNTNTLGSIMNTVTGKTSPKYENYMYKYKVLTFQLLIPGEEPFNILTEAINQIIITKEYDNNVHPVLEVITTLPPPIHKKIVKGKSDINVRLRIQKCKYSKQNELIISKDWINDSFQLISDDDTDFTGEEEYNKENERQYGTSGTGSGQYNLADYTTEYVLSLWKQSDIEAMRSVVNAIKADATISTVIADIYGKSGIKKILISPLDNDKSYSEIRIPPMNLLNLPDYLEKIYGTYYPGTMVFLDFRCLYFLSTNGVCDAKEPGEFTRTVFKIPKASSSKQLNPGTMEDKDNKVYYMNIESDNIDFLSPGNTTDAISGNNVAVIDTSKNETVAVDGVGTQRGSGNSKVASDNYSNEFNKASMLSKIVEQSSQVVISLSEYDEEALTPNKEFVIYYEDPNLQKRNGFYRVISSRIVLSKSSSGLEISSSNSFVFKAPIGTNNAVAEKKPTTTTVNTMNVTSTAKADASKEKGATTTPTVNAPGGKLDTVRSTNTVTTNSVTENKVTRNNDYNYDSLGNLQGVDIPEYNKITENDSLAVIEAKKQAQQKSLPCSGPKPKVA